MARKFIILKISFKQHLVVQLCSLETDDNVTSLSASEDTARFAGHSVTDFH